MRSIDLVQLRELASVNDEFECLPTSFRDVYSTRQISAKNPVFARMKRK